ncbi:MAG: antitoxin MazE family protein [Rhodospirillales bacterium]|nr:antitoxin MazE family protein [Rhodospirillales bacterium]MDE0712311.1 antitoxin MazE family protein [Rhodospirillales bacterium]
MPAASTPAQRVAKRRAALRAQGLRPIQIWVPDNRAPGFAEECARQAAVVEAANRADLELAEFMDTAARDLDEHLEAIDSSSGT